MLGRVREYFTLRGAIDEASRPDREVSAEAATLLAWGRQRGAAAEVLWANGHGAEALRLARAALETTLEAVSAAGDEGWRDLLHAELVAAIDHALRQRAMPRLDADMESEDADRYREVQRARRRADATVRYAVRTARELRSVRRRRTLAGLLVLLMVATALGFFIRDRIRASNAPWIGRYYPQGDFRGQPIERNDPDLDFDWQAESPMSGIPEDNWSARWDTCVRVTQTQEVLFSIGSDDGSRVFVDGRAEVENWRPQTERWEHGRVELEPGVHHVRVEFFEGGGRARIRARLASDAPLELFRPDDPDARCGRTEAIAPQPAKTGPTPMRGPTAARRSPMLPVQPNAATVVREGAAMRAVMQAESPAPTD